ncbi:MAG TPA: universal stress protein [Bacteroidia bacterium]|nr:universal stress protein [Bacteroidia bacterium]
MKTILVPTDFSKNADNACKYAIEIAKETKSKIILMHAYETPVLYTEVPLTMQMDYMVLAKSASVELKKYHDKISKTAKGVKIELVLQQGLASARIKEIALEKKVDLIVVGTTGKGALEKMIMGSNAARIIRKTPCLVLAIPPKAKYEGLKKIVYATDLLNENLNHAKTLIPFAKIFNSEILFLNVNTHLLSGNEEDDLKKIRTKIKSHVRYPKTSGYVCNDGNVANGINFFLKKHKADCLAMYTHHRGIWENIFKPSITKEVAIHPFIPLLVIHENDFAGETQEMKFQKEKMMN